MNILVILLLVLNLFISIWLIFKTKNSSEVKPVKDEAITLKASPLWLKVQETLTKELKDEGNPEMDELLVKLENLTITFEETNRLKILLISRWAETEKGSKDERASAYIMATIMDKVLIEASNKGKLVKVELVGESPMAE